MRRTIFEAEHEALRDSVGTFLRNEAVPHTKEWEDAGLIPRAFWEKAARHGFVGFEAPEEYGGAGISDFRFNAVIGEEVALSGTVGDNFMLQNDILAPYLIDLTTEEQRARWLPGFCSGRLIAAIAMTEPGTGSDLQGMTTKATQAGDDWVIDGAKTFVTSGIAADLVIVAARTDPQGGKQGFTLFGVEAGAAGFERGRKLKKSGRWAQDTAELFFRGVHIPKENVIGELGHGLRYLTRNLARERLAMAINAIASCERALGITIPYAAERKAFGTPIGSFQFNRITLAELSTKVQIARSHVDRCILATNDGSLTAAEAAGIKAWCTDLQNEVVDRCVQMHGGYGYMLEYEVARLWRDARVQRIYGGANEVMYEIVGRSLGL